MDSIVKPLLTQVKAVNEHYNQIVQGLSTGKPESKQMVKDLAKDARQLFANFREKSAIIKSGITYSPGFTPNVGIMIKMLIYYIGEISAFVQLMIELTRLVTNIISLTTIIDWFVTDLQYAKQLLQTKMLFLERAAERTTQKVTKNLEWIKTEATIQINEVFAKSQLQYYQKQLDTAKTNTLSATSKASQQSQQTINLLKVQSVLQDRVDYYTAQLADIDNQKKALADDKTYWKNTWKTEESYDLASLQKDSPKLGANQ